MNFQILFDKDALNSSFKAGWGFSLFVGGVLFDSGEDGSNLVHNLKAFDLSVELIEAVVISHDHWDHTGGLWSILELRRGLKVYGCFDFSEGFKKKVESFGGELIETKGPTQIKDDIYVTGQIIGFYKSAKIVEQAMVIKSKKGLVIISGCSHPGVVQVAETVKKLFNSKKIYLFIGGMHLMDKEKREVEAIAQRLSQLGVEGLAPAHCVGYQAQQVFSQIFKEKYIAVKAGEVIAI